MAGGLERGQSPLLIAQTAGQAQAEVLEARGRIGAERVGDQAKRQVLAVVVVAVAATLCYAGKRRHTKVLLRELAYFHHNRHRRDYARLANLGLPIGSGPIEAACKTVVQHRLKRSGMRWSAQGAQQVLNLRAQLCSGRWDTFWNWHLQHTDQLAAAA